MSKSSPDRDERVRGRWSSFPGVRWRWFGLRRVRLAVGLVAASTLLLAACSSTSSSSTSVAAAKRASGGKYTIYLSNNYMGNQWRPQMENDAKVVAQLPSLASKVNLVIQNASGTATAQIASLQSIIRAKPAAIMMDAASATALNPTVEAACRAGIVVFSFDQTVTAPCAYKLEENYSAEAHDMAYWLATEMHGHGNILEDTGLPGIPISETFLSVWNSILKKHYPNIHVVGTFSSQYAPGPELQSISSLMSQHVTINGILSGGYCSSDIQALQAAGRPLVPDTCLDVNGNEQICQKDHVPCFFFAAPAWVSGVALKDIVGLLDGSLHLPKNQGYYNENFVSSAGNISFNHEQKVVPLTPGVNYYPTESPSLITPVTGEGFHITAAEALNGPSSS